MTLIQDTPIAENTDSRWMKDGNCLGIDPDLFYPERGVSSANAKKVCQDCVVKTECLSHALFEFERLGIWGGTTEKERRAMRKELGIKKQQDDLQVA